jgi:DNA replication and repair protein RecF
MYLFREILVVFLQKHSQELTRWFSGKISTISFEYICQKNFQLSSNKFTLHENISNILKEHVQKDIILRTTSFWPHRDDFTIMIDDKIPLINFASRGEVKTTILWLKKFEIMFIEKYTLRKPILIIDDLLSELDREHKNLFLWALDWYQTFISEIYTHTDNTDSLISL